MKFGKEIQRRQLDLPEYAAHFVDYKSLKRLIKRLGAKPDHPAALSQMSDIQLPAPSGGSGSATPETTLPAPPGDPAARPATCTAALQANKDQFFFQLERALDKVNSIYLQKEAELKLRLTYLLNRKRSLLSEHSFPALSGPSPAQYISLEDGLRQFIHDLDKLQQFVEVNQTAFSKILKKWDKTSKSQQRALFLTCAVDVQPCFNREVIADLSDRASSNLQELAESIIARENEGSSPTTENPPAQPAPLLRKNSLGQSEDEMIQSGILHGAGAGDSTVLKDWLRKIESLSDARRRVSKVFLSTAEDAPEQAQRLLLESGLVDVCQIDELTGQNILHKAAITRRPLLRAAVFETSANLDAKAVDIYGRRPIHYAAIYGQVDLLKWLVSKAPDSMEDIDHDNSTPLVQAIMHNHKDAAEALLSLGASVNPQRPTDQVPVNIACQQNQPEMVDLLLKYQPGLISDSHGLYAQHVSARMGSVELIRKLKDYGADFSLPDGLGRWTPLMHAASEGKADAVQVLLDECGVDIEARDEKGCSALHYAAWEGHLDCTCTLASRAGRTAMKRVTSDLLDKYRSTEQPMAGPVTAQPLLSRGPAAFGLMDIMKSSAQPSALQKANLLPSQTPSLESKSLSSLMPDIPEITLPPPMVPLRRYGHNFLDQRTFAILSFYNLGYDAIKLYQPGRHPGVRLTISARSTDLVPRSVPVPLPDDSRILTFQIEDLDAFSIDFDVYPSYSAKIIARAVTNSSLFATNSPSIGVGHAELLDERLQAIGRVSFRFQLIQPFKGIPLELTHFATYWKQTADDMKPDKTFSSVSSLLSRDGPRAGQDGAVRKPAERRVVIPRVTGSSLSGEYIRLDVRLTCDGVPVVHFSPRVIFHGRRFFVSALTFSEFKSLWTGSRSEEGMMSDIMDEGGGEEEAERRRKESLYQVCRRRDSLWIREGLRTAHASVAEVLDALPLDVSVEFHVVVDGGEQGARKSREGPEGMRDVGKERSSSELATEASPRMFVFDVNKLADSVLAAVFDHARAVRKELQVRRDRLLATIGSGSAPASGPGSISDGSPGLGGMARPDEHHIPGWRHPLSRKAAHGRGVVFSSFDPDVCLALNWKQPNYPVLLCNAFSLSDGPGRDGSGLDGVVRDGRGPRRSKTAYAVSSSLAPSPWTGSLGEAVSLAQSNNLMGIICSARLLKLASSLVRSIKASGLVLISDAGEWREIGCEDGRHGGGDGECLECLRTVRRQQEKNLDPLLAGGGARQGRPDGLIDGALLAGGVLLFRERVPHV